MNPPPGWYGIIRATGGKVKAWCGNHWLFRRIFAWQLQAKMIRCC